MSCCGACRATFASLDGHAPGSKAEHLDEAHPKCRCQGCSVSEHSPGTLAPGECLIRILVSPQHVNDRGLPRASALTDAEVNGLSLFRAEHLRDDEALRRVAKSLVERARERVGPKAGVVGVLEMNCQVIRDLRREGEADACYCAYDTAEADNAAHAEAFQRVHEVPDEIRAERRRQLFKQVKSTFVPVAQFRDGVLLDLAPAIHRSIGQIEPAKRTDGSD